ncbi:hypothetical protein GS483_19665 [Rhodococcus hoagii]|nr:hypothetical protein [Prescottella equi]
MTLPTTPTEPTAQEPVQHAGQHGPKRSTQRWVKIVWALAAVLLTVGVVYSFLPVRLHLESTSLGKNLDCGTMWTHDTDDAIAAAREWETTHRREVLATGMRMPDLAGMVDRDCARALDLRSSNFGWMVFGSLVLTGVGFIGRARPSIPVRIVRR